MNKEGALNVEEVMVTDAACARCNGTGSIEVAIWGRDGFPATLRKKRCKGCDGSGRACHTTTQPKGESV
jgi:DnaJ-class molecular chaperone